MKENRTERAAALLEKANGLPFSPGVYIMKDRSGRVIYVGKSRRLKARVSQYFQNSEKNAKTARMVSLVYDFDNDKNLKEYLEQIKNEQNTIYNH